MDREGDEGGRLDGTKTVINCHATTKTSDASNTKSVQVEANDQVNPYSVGHSHHNITEKQSGCFVLKLPTVLLPIDRIFPVACRCFWRAHLLCKEHLLLERKQAIRVKLCPFIGAQTQTDTTKPLSSCPCAAVGRRKANKHTILKPIPQKRPFGACAFSSHGLKRAVV